MNTNIIIHGSIVIVANDQSGKQLSTNTAELVFRDGLLVEVREPIQEDAPELQAS